MAVAFRDAIGSRSRNIAAPGATTMDVAMPGAPLIEVLYPGPVASNNGGGGTTITVTLPTTRAVNDVLVMGVTVRGGTGTTITLPQNSAAQTWTLLDRSNSTTTLAQATYWKLATSTDVSDTTVVVTITSNKASAVCYAIRGANTGAPAAAQYSGQANASSLTISYAATGTWSSTDGVSLLFGGMAMGANTVGTATNYNNGAQASSTGGSAGSRTQSHGSHRFLKAVTTLGTTTEVWTGTAAVNIGSQVFIKQVAAAQTAVNGDVLVMVVNQKSSDTTKPSVSGAPSGWTQLKAIQYTGSSEFAETLYWKVASSEPAYTGITFNTACTGVACVIAISGGSATQPVAAQFAVAGHTSSTTLTSDAIGSWTSSDGVDIVAYGGDYGTITVDPASYTKPTDWTAGVNGNMLSWYYRALSAVTSVGAVTGTLQFASATIGTHIFILPLTVTGSFPASAIFRKVQTPTAPKADAAIGPVFTWVDPPADTVTMSSTPTLTFRCPVNVPPVAFEIQLDTVNTFNSGNLKTYGLANGTWEYYNGASWTAMPAGGVPETYMGQLARFTVPDTLTGVTWYRRIRYSKKG